MWSAASPMVPLRNRDEPRGTVARTRRAVPGAAAGRQRRTVAFPYRNGPAAVRCGGVLAALLTEDDSELVYTTAAGEGADDVTGMRVSSSHGIAGWVV